MVKKCKKEGRGEEGVGWGNVFGGIICVSVYTHIIIDRFTTPACKTSGLKDARRRLRTVYFPVL